MKYPLLLSAVALSLVALTATTLYAQATGTSIVDRMKSAAHAFTLTADLNAGQTGLTSSPITGKKTGDVLTAAEWNRMLEVVSTGGEGAGGGKPSRASLVRARGVNLPPPPGMSDWPDAILCTFAPGEEYIFDFYGTSGSGSSVAYWTQDTIGTYFNFDGTFITSQPLRGDPKCGSKATNIKDFCAEGRCIYTSSV